VAERSERLTLALIVIGLTGLGVPFVLAVGLWVLAVGSTVTFVQRVLVVRKAVGPGAPPQPATPQPATPQPATAPPAPAPPAAVRDPGEGGARKDKA
jgi:CDP-diacylglycerol--glycerol-3-phosphate 3-phosphatidyltransferase